MAQPVSLSPSLLTRIANTRKAVVKLAIGFVVGAVGRRELVH